MRPNLTPSQSEPDDPLVAVDVRELLADAMVLLGEATPDIAAIAIRAALIAEWLDMQDIAGWREAAAFMRLWPMICTARPEAHGMLIVVLRAIEAALKEQSVH